MSAANNYIGVIIMRDVIATKEILTREEVMEILKIGRSSFYKLIQTVYN